MRESTGLGNLAISADGLQVAAEQLVVVGYDEEAQKDIRASKIIIDKVINTNVEDIVIDQEKAKKSVRQDRHRTTCRCG